MANAKLPDSDKISFATHLRDLWRRGDPAVLLTCAGLIITLGLLAGMIGLVVYQGGGVFWPAEITHYELAGDKAYMGPLRGIESVQDETGKVTDRIRFNVQKGNKDLDGYDFVWIDEKDIEGTRTPEQAIRLERVEWGDFFGYLQEVRTPAGEAATTDEERFAALEAAIAADEHKERDTGAEILFRTASGKDVLLHSGELIQAQRPNLMGFGGKLGATIAGTWEFVTGEPRESNTQGGIWPALFGTCMMVIIMSVAVMPLGVVAAVYLREYATQGPLVRAIRIAVSNLAGVPSIVFGLFGLGFFVYVLGGSLDSLFFADKLPTPTFGTGGILWASLTLALLTLPVVIVATEESLAAVPVAAREGALALGSTKWQTIRSVVLPSAGPGILTGLILAIARGAGEVAPLMLTGAVAFAPQMPFDGSFPFFHFDRKFMHLGFHIYDLGFQSPNVEAAKPMVYATTLLLIALVVALNVTAIVVRTRLRNKLQGSAF